VSTSLIDEIRRALEIEPDPDRALKEAVRTLAAQPEISWAGIAFLEDGELALGPTAGTAATGVRLRVPITYDGDPVGELQVDGEPEPPVIEQIAKIVSPYVLIGWDMRGQPWEP